MGLDQYLYLRKRDQEKDEQIAYWRKFNALHKYITDLLDVEEDDCVEMDLSDTEIRCILRDLYEVKDILDKAERIYDPDQTEEEKDDWWCYSQETDDAVKAILPPCAGFFFGSQEIDAYYYEDVKRSIGAFEHALGLVDSGEEVYYYAWY